MSERPPEIQEHIRLIQALSDSELHAFERSLVGSENVRPEKWFAFHLSWNMREVRREWERRNA